MESPQNFDCIIQVLACGICHSDLHMIDNDWQISTYPLVPGHEVIGKVVEVSPQVNPIKVCDHVGVGWQRSACLQCRDCLRGNENLYNEIQGLIITSPGGFAFPIPSVRSVSSCFDAVSIAFGWDSEQTLTHCAYGISILTVLNPD